MEVVIVAAPTRPGALVGRRRRRPACAARPRRRPGPGHRVSSPLRGLPRPGPPARRRRADRWPGRAPSCSTSTWACPPAIPSATGRSSPASSRRTSTSRPARCAGPDVDAATVRPARRLRGLRGRHRGGRRRRPPAARHRHRRPHRVQRAGLVARLAHPDQDAHRPDPRRQRPLLRRRSTRCPATCVTQGVGTILEARHLVLLAFGAGQGRRVAAGGRGPGDGDGPGRRPCSCTPTPRWWSTRRRPPACALAGYYRETWAHKPAWQGL